MDFNKLPAWPQNDQKWARTINVYSKNSDGSLSHKYTLSRDTLNKTFVFPQQLETDYIRLLYSGTRDSANYTMQNHLEFIY